jgi:hypothetical protein
MKVIVVPWTEARAYDQSVKALEMSSWLKEQGLKHNLDFDWYFEPNFRQTKFRFHGDSEYMATMFALRWIK